MSEQVLNGFYSIQFLETTYAWHVGLLRGGFCVFDLINTVAQFAQFVGRNTPASYSRIFQSRIFSPLTVILHPQHNLPWKHMRVLCSMTLSIFNPQNSKRCWSALREVCYCDHTPSPHTHTHTHLANTSHHLISWRKATAITRRGILLFVVKRLGRILCRLPNARFASIQYMRHSVTRYTRLERTAQQALRGTRVQSLKAKCAPYGVLRGTPSDS